MTPTSPDVKRSEQRQEVINSYEEYLEWLRNNFFNHVRTLAEKRSPVLLTGFIMDQNGAIAKEGKVPREIANDDDWKAFMWLLSSADVFVTGMRYIERVIKALKEGKRFQNILFPYEAPENDEFLKSLKANFFSKIGEFREAQGLPRSPDIFIATTNVEKYREILESPKFKQIIEIIKRQGRNIVIIKEAPFTSEEIKLMQEADVSWQSYVRGQQNLPGQSFIETIASRFRENHGKEEVVIANTTGPSIKRLFEQATEQGEFPFFIEAVVVNNQLTGDKLTFFEGNQPISDPIKHLKRQGFTPIATTQHHSTNSVSGAIIEETFNVLAKNI